MTEFLKRMDRICMVGEEKDDPRRVFHRIHDQYIIPLTQIEYPAEDLRTVVLRCREELPIGETYLPDFKKAARFFT